MLLNTLFIIAKLFILAFLVLASTALGFTANEPHTDENSMLAGLWLFIVCPLLLLVSIFVVF